MQTLPLPPPGAPRDIYAWAGRLVSITQAGLDDLARAAPLGIAVTGVTPATTFNAGTATLAQTASALGQLILALQKKGVTT